MLTLTWTCDTCGEAFERKATDPQFLVTPPGWTVQRDRADFGADFRYACRVCAAARVDPQEAR